MIKGILTAEDARRAVAEGVDAIVVSNHGGNVLDGSVATLRVLPEIVDAVGDEIEVLMDGGVRRGTDVVKAVALGARAVLLGRAYVYPLLAAGEPGVRRILELFHQQIDEALAFLGVESVHDLDPSLLDLPVGWPERPSERSAVAVAYDAADRELGPLAHGRAWPDHRSRPGGPVEASSRPACATSSRRSAGAGYVRPDRYGVPDLTATGREALVKLVKRAHGNAGPFGPARRPRPAYAGSHAGWARSVNSPRT